MKQGVGTNTGAIQEGYRRPRAGGIVTEGYELKVRDLLEVSVWLAQAGPAFGRPGLESPPVVASARMNRTESSCRSVVVVV